jgi:hypothetical protein
MEFTEAESNMHDLVSSDFLLVLMYRLLNTNSIKMLQLIKRRNTMRKLLLRNLQSKDWRARILDGGFNLISLPCVFYLFFNNFIRSLW